MILLEPTSCPDRALAFVSSSLAVITIKAFITSILFISAAQCNAAHAWCDNLLPVSAIHPVHCLHG